MNVLNTIKNLCKKLGENNKPTYAVMAIAIVKGIARPLFTLSDKDTDPVTKKYTALRECLTEVVAIPTYYFCGELAGKVADKLKFDNLGSDVHKQYARKNAKQNFMFIGVCTAALAVIPALASVTIKPFMNKIIKNKKQANNEISTNLDINSKCEVNDNTPNKNPVFQSKKKQILPLKTVTYNYNNSMKAGRI